MGIIFIPVFGHVSSNDSGAKKVACETYIKDYDAKIATVQQMQTYADCVKTLHPTDGHADKVFVAVILIAAIIGAIIGYNSDEFYGDRFIGCVIGGFLGALVLSLVVLVVMAVMYVFK